MLIYRSIFRQTLLMSVVLIAISFPPAMANDASLTSTPVPVPVLQVEFQEQLEILSTWPATVSARRQSALGFERGGLIAEVFVDVGDKVSKGDRLASLNTTMQRADLAAAKAAIAQAKTSRDITLATAKRQRSLADAGHISPQRLEEILANQASADAALSAAIAQAKALEARLSLSRIHAPYSGTIINRFLDEGAIAGPNTAVLELVESGALELVVGLPIDNAQILQEGDKVQISTNHGKAQAQVRRSTNIVNPVTQTVEVVFDLIDQNPKLTPGQSVRIELKDQLEQRGFLVPLAALREGRRGLWTLYTLLPQQSGEDYILTPVPVEILYANEREVYVRGPIDEGTLVLEASGQNTAVGMVVSPVKVARK